MSIAQPNEKTDRKSSRVNANFQAQIYIPRFGTPATHAPFTTGIININTKGGCVYLSTLDDSCGFKTLKQGEICNFSTLILHSPSEKLTLKKLQARFLRHVRDDKGDGTAFVFTHLSAVHEDQLHSAIEIFDSYKPKKIMQKRGLSLMPKG
ncbi:hypothetical protein A9Q91_03075 [Candidatus Gracilibacteria bacterium 28_42_T64]|nr:hypothetical protein A9Q91_03075 [Candidatus Gracilibacteria bacterium 28_42_T64]